ncbi:MAG: DNA-protecting protein DprA [Flavobacteriales bacterium]|nr:MAG: DNA-protecting protein DprA [Flavobacteriales bacterium]
MNQNLLYSIALTAIPNIGDITAKKLIAYCGSAEQVFNEKKPALEKIPGIGEVNAQSIIQNKAFALTLAENELTFIEKHHIKALTFFDENYPKRLTHCEDGPLVIFAKGEFNFNAPKIISIVGTRNATEYGKDFCEKLIADLAPHRPLILSGLAFGIDICAHKAAIKNNLPTVAALAHGLDRIYPSTHTSTAKQMLENGGLVSDFRSGTNPDRENFPKRNRLVAGIADVTIVIESSNKGGSLITAELANSYSRDVFALPGRVTDIQSEGCNALIKSNRAHLLQSVKDLEYIMGWKIEEANKPNQTKLFVDLTAEEKLLVDVLNQQEKTNIDDLALLAKLPMSKTASLLLEMEFKNVVKSLPGKMYKLV